MTATDPCDHGNDLNTGEEEINGVTLFIDDTIEILS